MRNASLPLLLATLLLPRLATPQPPQAPPPDPLAVLAELPVLPALDHGVRVVVKDEQGAPAQGARLVHATAASMNALRDEATRAFPGDEVGYFAFLHTKGSAYAVDERGASRVPAESGRLFAFRDGMVASVPLSVRDGQSLPRVELVLRPATSFTVEVVDSNGAPARSVQVGVQRDAKSSVEQQRSPGEDGTAAFRLLAGRAADKALVVAVIAAREPVNTPMPADGGRALLQLPKCGSVRASYAGELLPGARVTWSLGIGNRRAVPTEADDRASFFGHVGVGFRGRVLLQADDVRLESPEFEIAAEGEQTVVVEAAKDRRHVVLRVLDAEGQPARDMPVRIGCRHDRGSSSRHGRTNREGWLDIDAQSSWRGTGKIHLDLIDRDVDALLGSLDLEVAEEEKGRIDRGELRVAKPEVALAGIAVDASGKPLAGINMQAGAGHSHSYSLRTGPDGRFALALPVDKPASVLLQLTGAAWYFSGPTCSACSVDLGKDVRLVLQPAGRVRFAAPGAPPNCNSAFSYVLEPAEEGGKPIELPRLNLAAKEQLLPPGNWHFVVKLGERELHRIENVRVEPGIEVHDPRFMSFDWRAFATVVAVRVEDKDGTPCDACTVWLHYGGNGHGSAPRDGLCSWLVPNEGGALKVEPADKSMAAIDLGVVAADQVVRLGTGPKLEIRLSRLPKLPDGVTLIAIPGGSHEGVPFDGEGKAALFAAKAGELTVRLAAKQGTTSHVLQKTFACEVPAGGHTLSIEVTDELQREIERRVGTAR